MADERRPGATGQFGYGGSNVDTAGLITPPNPLEQGEDAVLRAMRMIGLNPGSFSPVATAIRKKAGNLVNELVLNAIQTGNVDALTQPAQALNMLAGLIQQGVGGGKIFGGKGDALSTLASIGERTDRGEGASPGENLIGQLLSSPRNAQALFLEGKYGGLSGQAQGAQATALAGLIDSYQQQLEGGSASGTSVSGLLRTLLGQQPTSGMGAPQPLGGGGMGAQSTPGSVPGAGAITPPAGFSGPATPPSYGQQFPGYQLPGMPAYGQPPLQPQQVPQLFQNLGANAYMGY